MAREAVLGGNLGLMATAIYSYIASVLAESGKSDWLKYYVIERIREFDYDDSDEGRSYHGMAIVRRRSVPGARECCFYLSIRLFFSKENPGCPEASVLLTRSKNNKQIDQE